jgi:hypothetical protein
MSKIKKPQKLPPVPLAENATINPTISEEQERLIGKAIVAWSKLENAMQDVIWAFLGLEMNDGRVVTGRLDAIFKMNMLEGLAPSRLDEAELDNFLKVIDTMRFLYGERNIIAHGSWGTLEPDGIPIAASLKFVVDTSKGAKPSDVICEHFPKERMNGIIGGIYFMIDALGKLLNILTSRRKQI